MKNLSKENVRTPCTGVSPLVLSPQTNFSMSQDEVHKTGDVTESDLQGVGKKDDPLAQVMKEGLTGQVAYETRMIQGSLDRKIPD